MRQSHLKERVTIAAYFYGAYCLLAVGVFVAANESFLPTVFRLYAVVGAIAPFYVLAAMWLALRLIYGRRKPN